MIRKRAPGAGRKPAGPISGKLANFSTRISQETRVALEASAGASGQSISQVAEQMIRLGLDTAAERERSNPTQALTFFIAELAEGCSVNLENTVFHWNTDSFVFDALVHALQLLLQRLKPSDSNLSKRLKDLDEDDREFLESPKDWARYVFKVHWDELMNTASQLREGKMPFGELSSFLKTLATDPAKGQLHGLFSEVLKREYKLDKFRRDLNLKIPPRRKSTKTITIKPISKGAKP